MTYGGRPPLTLTHKALVEQWDYERNRVSPNDVTAGSSKKVWWVCDKGHAWDATIVNRTTRNSGCRVCAGKEVLGGYNDLATTDPDVAAQWHTDNLLKPTEVTRSSSRKVKWKCAFGHTWSATISNRTSRRSGCGVCDGKEVLEGFNDLHTLNPALAAHWHPDNELTPREVTRHASVVVRWRCHSGHEWESSVLAASHLSPPHYCGTCSGRKVLKGYNDLSTTHPELSRQWDASNALSPSDVSAGSERIVLWNCTTCTHTWTASPKDRKRGRGCPRCANGKTTSQGEAELAAFVEGAIGAGRVMRNVRGCLGGKFEVDVHVPSMSVGIEFNGVYYHSEEFVGATYHADKFHAADASKEALIQVWEDDWRDRREAVEMLLLRKLRASKAVRRSEEFSASKLSVSSARRFFAANSVQKLEPGLTYLALMDGSATPYAVMAFTLTIDACLIKGYATHGVVIGGFIALIDEIRSFTNERASMLQVVTDNCVTNGESLLGYGFSLTQELPPTALMVARNTRGASYSKETRRVWDAGTRIWSKEMHK